MSISQAEGRLLEWAAVTDGVGPAVYPSATVESKIRAEREGASSRGKIKSDGPTPRKAFKAARELEQQARAVETERAIKEMPPRMRNLVAIMYCTRRGTTLPMRLVAEVLRKKRHEICTEHRMALAWLSGRLQLLEPENGEEDAAA